jgi:hypothetical protein
MMILGGESNEATNLQMFIYAQNLVALSSAFMWFQANLIMSFLKSLKRGKRCSRNNVEILRARRRVRESRRISKRKKTLCQKDSREKNRIDKNKIEAICCRERDSRAGQGDLAP